MYADDKPKLQMCSSKVKQLNATRKKEDKAKKVIVNVLISNQNGTSCFNLRCHRLIKLWRNVNRIWRLI